MSRLNAIALLVLSASLPVWAILPARTGALNAVSGDVLRNGVPISDLDVGGAVLRPGDRIETRYGMAEILLAPGSVLRIGDGSELALASGTTEFLPHLKKGSAMLEVLQAPAVPLLVEENGAAIAPQRPGLYLFNSGRRTVEVYRGTALLKRDGKEIVLPAGVGARLSTHLKNFAVTPDTTAALYRWSAARAEHLNVMSADLARELAGKRSQWHGPGWYWDGFWNAYAFVPSAGATINPFGWPYNTPGKLTDRNLPEHGDPYLYGPPVLSVPSHVQTAPETASPPPLPPTLPLSAPGEPTFPSSRSGGTFGGAGFGRPD